MPNKGSKPRTIDAAEGSIVVKVPIADVYERWLAFEDYPKFITPIKRVRKLDANHFVASLGFNGKQYETTLEFMLCVPERRLGVLWPITTRVIISPRVSFLSRRFLIRAPA